MSVVELTEVELTDDEDEDEEWLVLDWLELWDELWDVDTIVCTGLVSALLLLADVDTTIEEDEACETETEEVAWPDV